MDEKRGENSNYCAHHLPLPWWFFIVFVSASQGGAVAGASSALALEALAPVQYSKAAFADIRTENGEPEIQPNI